MTSCATPTTPTGGPRDEQGPTIVETEPETGTVNFSERSIKLHFSEYVNRSSLNQALVVEPEIGIKYNLDWGRKSVAINFDQAIPDSTTLIVTVGTDFTDTHSNKMTTPKKIAVSTGPEIDKGKLTGKVIDASTGEGDEGDRILLYRTTGDSTDLTQKADYIASTDTGGTVQFSYLSEGKYKMFWVDDRNRNKIWEPDQERAQPFLKETITLDKADSSAIGTIFNTTVDTTKPRLQGVGLFSSQRMRMRFSENIHLTDSVKIAITDTTGKPFGNAYPLYLQPEETFILFAQSKKPLSETSSYKITLNGITDEAENMLEPNTEVFTGSAQKDTTKQRIIKRNNLAGYYPSDPIKITYAKPIDEPAVKDSLVIVEGDTLMKKNAFKLATHRNMLRIAPKKEWQDGVSYEVRVWDPIIEDYRKIRPNIWHSSQMGKLHVSVEDSTLKNISLKIENEKSGIQRDTVFSDSVVISNLPPLDYKVISFLDRNNNGKWDYGQVVPFVKPEPYFIQKRVPVKKEMTGELLISFQK